MTFPTVTEANAPHHLAWVGHLVIPGQSESFTGALVWMSRGLLAKTQAGFEAMQTP